MRGYVAFALLALGCAEPPAAPVPAEPEPAREAVRLDVPPGLLERAAHEAAGLALLPPTLRRQALERGREAGSPSYATLRERADALEGERVSYEGQVALVRPAGPNVFLLALRTRQVREHWADPIYVLSVVRPEVPADAIARVDGWVAGERTIGRHALPLVVAFSVEAVERE